MPTGKEVQERIELHERLARIEELLRHITEEQKEQKQDDEKLDGKIDKILDNDKNKLERIAKTEQKVKNIKATMFVFLAAIAGALARWFV